MSRRTRIKCPECGLYYLGIPSSASAATTIQDICQHCWNYLTQMNEKEKKLAERLKMQMTEQPKHEVFS